MSKAPYLSPTASSNRAYRSYITAPTQYKDSVFNTTTAFKPVFRQHLQKALGEYGLWERLHSSQKADFKALNLACAEGIYLHLLAELLEGEKLAEVGQLCGLDSNQVHLGTAEEFARLSNPPRPYLNFYLHDLGQPLRECLELVAATGGQVKFDFIFGLNALHLTPNAAEVLAQLYQDNLKPGGVLYLREFVTTEGEEGWQLPHPAFGPIAKGWQQYAEAINPGGDIARQIPKWLGELGAEKLEVNPDLIPWGGPSQRGKEMMRDVIKMWHLAAPSLIERGWMSQADHEEGLRVVYHELTEQVVGQIVHLDILAQKPG